MSTAIVTNNDSTSKFEAVVAIVAGTAQAMDVNMKPDTLEAISTLLMEYPIDDIRSAAVLVAKNKEKKLSLRDFILYMPDRAMFTGEAWAFALANKIWDRDGERTEIPKAIYEAFPFSIYNGGNGSEYAARLAFEESYPAKLVEYEEKKMWIRHRPQEAITDKTQNKDADIADLLWRIDYCENYIKERDPNNPIHARQIEQKQRNLEIHRRKLARLNGEQVSPPQPQPEEPKNKPLIVDPIKEIEEIKNDIKQINPKSYLKNTLQNLGMKMIEKRLDIISKRQRRDYEEVKAEYLGDFQI